ncbi:uncharacterized protein PV09_04585 [Verruconis gallopava]|uniref:SP-RING-type domain-containing protein n=1 Tax=Verruconis gallopava TaxID=253628 RepID=A0A0D2AYN8_9PEZI|nr:uncharacterized protein PV09_04585 [Verruconis gallopava]KIW04289.1 hypothetical protein PV09_04585 [Verruconis gallopava]
MAPTRARSELPSASQRLAVRPEATGILSRQLRSEIPEYEPPKYPLSDTSRRKLEVLAKKYERRDLGKKHAAALKLLSACAHDINEELANLERQLDKQQKKAEKGAENADVESWQQKLDDYKPKHQNFQKRIEKYARTCVDLTQRHEALVKATQNSAEAAPLGQTPSQRVTRSTQAESMSSFEPTLPGGTAADADGDIAMAEASESALQRFKTQRQKDVEHWKSLSLFDRYANNRDYANYKEAEHEGYYGDEQDVPPPMRWFQTEEPAPGTATQGAAEESDDDVQISSTRISTKCPLTLREFVDPVMSTVCKHTFEKDAIVELIGNRPRTQCPVGGCSNHITKAQLAPNEKLLRKIRRIQQSRSRRREELDDETIPRGTNANTSILLSDGPDAGGFQSLDADFIPKKEAMSQSQQRTRAMATQSDVTDDDLGGE